MNKEAKHIGTFGASGCGKSTYTKQYLKSYGRVVVYDPMDEYGAEGFTRCTSLAQIVEAMKKGQGRAYKIAYFADDTSIESHPAALSDLVEKVLFPAQIGYKEGKSDKKILLVVEEANKALPNEKLPKECRYGLAVANQGRHYGVDLAVISQRPALVSTEVRNACLARVYFRLGHNGDVSEIERELPAIHKGKLREFAPHHFIKVRANGDIETGKNRLR
jgi:DNA helicase HerA-like ATPase